MTKHYNNCSFVFLECYDFKHFQIIFFFFGQDEPTYFPREMLEKKHVNFPTFQGCHTLSNIPKHSGTVDHNVIRKLKII